MDGQSSTVLVSTGTRASITACIVLLYCVTSSFTSFDTIDEKPVSLMSLRRASMDMFFNLRKWVTFFTVRDFLWVTVKGMGE